MGRHVIKHDEKSAKKREHLSRFYEKNTILYKIKYMMKTYDIADYELEHLETNEDKYLYCLQLKDERKLEKLLMKITNKTNPVF